MAVVPYLDDLPVAKSKDVDYRDVLAAAEELHPPNIWFEIPLPTRGDEVALGDLVIERTRHRSAVPEELRDLFLLVGLLHRILPVADVVRDVCRRKYFIHGGRVVLEPDLFIKAPGERFVLFLDLAGANDRHGKK